MKPIRPKPPIAVKLTPKKALEIAAARESLAAYIDELGDLEKEILRVREKFHRSEVLRTLIRKCFQDRAATDGFSARGEKYLAALSPCAWRQVVDYRKLRQLIGTELYADLSNPTIKLLEATIAPDILSQVITGLNAGPRTVKTFDLLITPKAEKAPKPPKAPKGAKAAKPEPEPEAAPEPAAD